jgi:hypothetical protein
MPLNSGGVASPLKRELPAVLLVLLFVGIGIAGIWLSFDRGIESEEQIGTLEAIHQIPSTVGTTCILIMKRA